MANKYFYKDYLVVEYSLCKGKRVDTTNIPTDITHRRKPYWLEKVSFWPEGFIYYAYYKRCED